MKRKTLLEESGAANCDSWATPPLSIETLAADCSLTPATVRKHLRLAVQEGWIERQRVAPGVYIYRPRLPLQEGQVEMNGSGAAHRGPPLFRAT